MHLIPIALIFAAAPLASASAQELQTSPTVGHWKFEEAAAGTVATGALSILDSSANGLHGTPHGGPVYAHTDAPIGDTALQFNGSNQWIAIADHPLFEITESLTIEAYVELSRFPTTQPPGVILWRGDRRSFLDPYSLEVEAQGQITFYVQDETGAMSKLTSDRVLNLGEMVHVAATFDHTIGLQSIYLNGAHLCSKYTNIRPFATLTGPEPGVGIGSLSQHANFLFPGKIDEVRLSNTDLSPSEFLPPLLSLTGDVEQISLAVGGEQRLTLNAPSRYANSGYFMLGSFSGTEPGLPLGGLTLPLNADRYLRHTFYQPSESLMNHPLGLLDANGEAEVVLNIPPGRAWLAGLKLNHAFVLLGREFVSNPVPLTLIP